MTKVYVLTEVIMADDYQIDRIYSTTVFKTLELAEAAAVARLKEIVLDYLRGLNFTRVPFPSEFIEFFDSYDLVDSENGPVAQWTDDISFSCLERAVNTVVNEGSSNYSTFEIDEKRVFNSTTARQS